ncbi:MAG: histidinol-phosphate transaminase [Vampirovibrionales bacterium]
MTGAIGGQMVKVESPGYRFSPELLIAACREHNPKVLYLPNPNNPTGTYLTTEELRQVIDGCPPTTLVLIDEAYTEFCQHLDDYPDALTMRQDNVVVCRTFSKAYGLAGMRVAYAVGHEKVIQQLMKVKMTFEPSNVAQAGAIAALQDEDFLKKVVANNETEKNRYYEFFMQHHCHYVSSSGNFVLLKLRDTDQVEALNNALLQRGIAIRPLTAFGYPDCVRISIGLPEENTALMQALSEVLPTL